MAFFSYLQDNCNIPTEFSFCWDKVQLMTEAKHQGNDNRNQFLLHGITFAVRNRISVNEANDEDVMDAVVVKAEAILPTRKTLQAIQERMIYMIAGILSAHIECAQHLMKRSTKPILHEYSTEMRQKSTVVSVI